MGDRARRGAGHRRRRREIELSPVEPSLLPWAIARSVGLGPREQTHEAPLAVPAEALGRRRRGGRRARPEAAAAALEGCGPRVSETLSAVLRERRSSWTATSAWMGEDGEQRVSSVAVVDGGAEGLWLSRHEGEPPDTVVHLEPVPPSVVWERIVALMPHPGA